MEEKNRCLKGRQQTGKSEEYGLTRNKLRNMLFFFLSINPNQSSSLKPTPVLNTLKLIPNTHNVSRLVQPYRNEENEF